MKPKNFEMLILEYEAELLEESVSKSLLSSGLIFLAALASLGAEAGNANAKVNRPTIENKVKSSILSKISNLIPALIKVESNGDPNAVGDHGRAKGILQIWNKVVQDVNRIYKTKFLHDDAFDKEKAKDIATKYLSYYGKMYESQTGKPASQEVLARIWNGGPQGWKNQNTTSYWQKVKSFLFEKNNV